MTYTTTTYITVEITGDDVDPDKARDAVQEAAGSGSVSEAIWNGMADCDEAQFDRSIEVRTFVADRKDPDVIEPLVAAVEELTIAVKELGWSEGVWHDTPVLKGGAAKHSELLLQFIANANIDNFWGPA